MSIHSHVVACDYHVPDNLVTNDDLAKIMDTSDEWIQQRSGIKQRYWVKPEYAGGTSGLAQIACEGALKKAGWDKHDIELVIFATLSPDHDFPGTGCFLQEKMGLKEIAILDIRQQCTGFIYGMTIADQFIKTGMYKKIMVVGAEVHSRGLEKSDSGREVSVLFGDGAGCVLMEPTEVKDPKKDSFIIASDLHADGNYARELWVPAPGTAFENEKDRLTKEMFDNRMVFPLMKGKSVFMHASKRMPEAVMAALKKSGFGLDDVDLFIFHQANLRINEMVAKILKIPAEKVFNTIDRFANTTAATIPIGFTEAEKAGKLKKGDLVVTAAFGAGFTWAGQVIRW